MNWACIVHDWSGNSSERWQPDSIFTRLEMWVSTGVWSVTLSNIHASDKGNNTLCQHLDKTKLYGCLLVSSMYVTRDKNCKGASFEVVTMYNIDELGLKCGVHDRILQTDSTKHLVPNCWSIITSQVCAFGFFLWTDKNYQPGVGFVRQILYCEKWLP